MSKKYAVSFVKIDVGENGGSGMYCWIPKSDISEEILDRIDFRNLIRKGCVYCQNPEKYLGESILDDIEDRGDCLMLNAEAECLEDEEGPEDPVHEDRVYPILKEQILDQVEALGLKSEQFSFWYD